MIIGRRYLGLTKLQLTDSEIDYFYHLILRGTYSGAPGFEDTDKPQDQLLQLADHMASNVQCQHGNGMTEYCEPCGRINGGG